MVTDVSKNLVPFTNGVVADYMTKVCPSIARQFQKTWLISVIGGVMVCIGCGMLFWNEGRAVRRAASLEGK